MAKRKGKRANVGVSDPQAFRISQIDERLQAARDATDPAIAQRQIRLARKLLPGITDSDLRDSMKLKIDGESSTILPGIRATAKEERLRASEAPEGSIRERRRRVQASPRDLLGSRKELQRSVASIREETVPRAFFGRSPLAEDPRVATLLGQVGEDPRGRVSVGGQEARGLTAKLGAARKSAVSSAKGRAFAGKGAMGIGGAAILIPILQSIFGDKKEEIPAAVQFAIAQQQMAAQGAGSGDTSRQLMDVKRLLAIIKSITDMGSLQGAGPSPRLI